MNNKFKNKFRIETTRLKDYDYSSNGAYFITLCADKFKQYFGKIENERVFLSVSGVFAEQCWREIPDHFPFIQIDEFVIMPNHVHGIIIIDSAPCRDVAGNVSTEIKNDGMSKISPKKGTISSVIRSYKSAVTKAGNANKLPFKWQSGFYEHVIRNNDDLQLTREYIVNNPMKWHLDQYNRSR
jgi:REP element-mobilizing transposase RayT